jgi:hypothetical protein
MTVIAVIGAQALYLFLAWLASAIAASYLSSRKGYGERPGLASGLIVPIISVIVWVFMPARPDSDWKVVGPFGRQKVTDHGDPAAGREPAGGPGPTGSAA